MPTAQQVLGINLGDRDVTTAESDRYLLAVDAASPRVTSGVAATSVQGRPLRYAIVGRPERVTSTGLAAVRASAAKLMDPRTSDREAAQIAAADPAILWIAANVHGGEESGTDASLRVLYELADRSDCAAQRILDQAVVVILPIQNPDGREADTRRNANGFDMNRDWFARTQPETDGKVELLRRYPGVLFIDAHEFGGTDDYFFPPNADPVYHDIADPAVDWINDIYGAAMQDEFDERGIPYFNYDTYDLFYAGYGDTVPANGFGAAGMTFEKANGDPAPQRVFEQYITQWTSLSAAAINKERILREWHGSWVEAVRQGEAGELEPNRTYEPGVPVSQPVPDRTVRHYFLRADDPDKAREVQALVRRLQRMDVEVRRLSRAADRAGLPRLRPRAGGDDAAHRHLLDPDGAAPEALGPGDAQREHLHAGRLRLRHRRLEQPAAVQRRRRLVRRGARAEVHGRRRAGRAGPAGAAREAAVDRHLLDVAAVRRAGSSPRAGCAGCSTAGASRYRDVSATDIANGGLSGVEVLLVPDGYALKDPSVPSDPYGYKDLGPKGRENLKAWVQDGGRYVGWLDGGVLASALGISGTVYGDGGDAGVSTPGSLFRVRVNDGSPLAAGVGPFAWVLDDARYVLTSGAGAGIPLRYPDAGSSDFFVSGPGRRRRGARRPPGGDGRARRPRPRGGVRLRPELPRVRRRDGEAAAQRRLRRRPGHRAGLGGPGGVHAPGDPRHAPADGGEGPAAARRAGARGARREARARPLRRGLPRPAGPRAGAVRDRQPGRRPGRRASVRAPARRRAARREGAGRHVPRAVGAVRGGLHGQPVPMFLFFSNRLGCFGSLLVSAVLT